MSQTRASRRSPPLSVVLRSAGLAFLILAALALATACGGSSDKTAKAPTATVILEAAAPTPTEEPPPPEPENRLDCHEIVGTAYLSPEEEQWFREHCAGLDGPLVAPGPPGSQVPIGDRLVIPKAGVDTTVSRVTVPESGQMPDPQGYFNAVWYDFSGFSGFGGYVNAGNMILSGHVDCARCHNGGTGTAIFWSVRNLKEGDTAQYVTADGRTIDYVVFSSQALQPNAPWDTIVGSVTADMTLITCTGTFSGGDYSMRHVVALRKA